MDMNIRIRGEVRGREERSCKGRDRGVRGKEVRDEREGGHNRGDSEFR